MLSFSYALAKTAADMSRTILSKALKRPAANFPGKLANMICKETIEITRDKIKGPVMIVLGTNGKSTTTAMIASMLEATTGKTAWNNTGANLDSGISSSLLEADGAVAGVFECDELWFAHVAKQLRPDIVVLGNLSPDQEDRMGSIRAVQDSIIFGLNKIPEAKLVYNNDDPNCTFIAESISNELVGFGFKDGQDPTPPYNVSCPWCEHALSYEWTTFAHNGEWTCSGCGRKRPYLDVVAKDLEIEDGHTAMTIEIDSYTSKISIPYPAIYFAYDALAALAAAHAADLDLAISTQALPEFSAPAGRLEEISIKDARVIVNLAKNPVGVTEALKIACSDPTSRIYVAINDKEGDGRDISWFEDVVIDTSKLGERVILCGGDRKDDITRMLQNRGCTASAVPDFAAELEELVKEEDAIYVVANYTAMPVARKICLDVQSKLS